MGTGPAAPIPMPSPQRRRSLAEEVGQCLGLLVRRAEAEARRVGELLHVARTGEGRRRNVAPLMMLAASSAFMVGAAWGVWRGRHGRAQ